ELVAGTQLAFNRHALKTGVCNHSQQALASKHLKMRSVEDSAVVDWPISPHKQMKKHVEVSHIGHRNDNNAAVLHALHHFLENSVLRPGVLDAVSQNGTIKDCLGSQLTEDRVVIERANDDPLVILSRQLSHVLTNLNSANFLGNAFFE